MTEPESRHRVFFALWPDDALRVRLAALARSLNANGRPVPPAHLHLTLAFPGTVGAPVLGALIAQGDAVRAPRCKLVLDRLGYFPRPKVAWLGSSGPVPLLEDLAARLRWACEVCGVKMEDRPFRPHVTLRRFVTRFEPGPVEPVEWSAREMVLIESGQAGQPGPYRVLRSWPLGSDPGEVIF